jgi:hypothetical protein
MSQFLFAVSSVQFVAYEGEGGDPGAGTPPAKTFTQEDLNKHLAEDRRKHQAKMADLETKLQQTLQTSQMSDQTRQELETSLADVQNQLLTKDQIAKLEQKKIQDKYESDLKQARERGDTLEKKYTESTIQRSIADAAAVNGAFNPTQVVTLLRGMTKLVDDKPIVEFPDKNVETGADIVLTLSPADAVKRMKELPDTYGNLFKSNLASGLGANSGAGSSKPLDVKNLTPEEYRKLRKENPSALGLGSRK